MQTQIRPAVRFFISLLGILLVAGAFVGVLVTGTSTNQPVLKVAVAARDISVGERLQETDFRLVDQIIDPALARLYVQAHEAGDYIGAPAIDLIRRGDPLNKVKFAGGDDAAAFRRYTLVLTDANDVLMTIPVDPDLIPPNIAAGDTINILFIAGDESGTRQLPASAQPTDVWGTPASVPVDLPTPGPELDGAGLPLLAPTPTPAAPVALPMADLMLQRVPVIDVTRVKLQNPAFGSGQAPEAQPFIDGAISSIVVKVPRQAQTLLGFGIATSKLRFTVASPVATSADERPELGMDWNTYLSFYAWKQEQALARGESLRSAVFPNYQPVTPEPPAASTR